MRRMMQSMVQRLECYKFNALLALLTLILHERFAIVFGITVNPFDSVVTSTISSLDEFIGTADKTHEFASEVYDLNNIDYSQYANDHNKFVGSPENTNTGSFEYVSPGGDYDGATIKKKPSYKNRSDAFNEYIKMFALHHSTFEMPNFFTNRISVNARIVSPPPPSFTHYPQPVRATLVRTTIPQSPLNAITDGIKDRLKAIYPGTLWCGDGNQAKYQNEVGLFRNTDICCKQHDECPAFIKSGSEFKGLRNGGLFTRSHCDCDWKFYNCLKRTNTLISNKIGYTYFNILRPQCFRKEYPIVGCKKWINKKCYMYTVDDQNTPVWQWFENKLY